MRETLKTLPELAALPLCIIVGLVFFAATSPGNLPPVALVFGFVILFGIVYCAARLIGKLLKLPDKMSKAQYTGLLMAATLLPVLLLSLQSIGQLTVRDIVTLLVLFLVAYIYVSRMSNPR